MISNLSNNYIYPTNKVTHQSCIHADFINFRLNTILSHKCFKMIYAILY